MGLIREPKNVDFSMKSEPWTEEELKEFSAIIKKEKPQTWHVRKEEQGKSKALRKHSANLQINNA